MWWPARSKRRFEEVEVKALREGRIFDGERGKTVAAGGRHPSFHQFVCHGRFKIVAMKGCRRSVSIQANADAAGVNAAADNRSHPVCKSGTPARTKRAYSNTIAN